MTGSFTVPILFLIYRQPEITSISFSQIKKLRPTRLFISADGPRADCLNDKSECEATRSIVNQIDWPCHVEKRFLPENVGLKIAVSSAINWFFSHVEEGIILEYDCFVELSFFAFCQELLLRYRYEHDVFSISAINLQNGIWRGDGDYYYSHLFGCWGWATWKRAWNHWSPTLPKYEQFTLTNQISNFVVSDKARRLITQSFNDVFYGKNTTTWAFCFEYAQMFQYGISIVPNHNLVSNIGFNRAGTHAKDPNHPLANMPVNPLTSYRAPTFKIPNIKADELQTLMCYRQTFLNEFRALLVSFLKKLLPWPLFRFIKHTFSNS